MSQINDAFVRGCYPKLLAFAKLQLADATRAEDVVQESLIAAMQYRDRFAGRSAFETWLFAILKNKIIDELRAAKKYINASALADEGGSDELLLTTFFNQDGEWHADTAPSAFDDSWCVADSEDSQAFWQVFELCLTKLPTDQARVFFMKEYMELDTDEICQACQISSQNFYVLMHRARLRLQQCLKLNWFDDEI